MALPSSLTSKISQVQHCFEFPIRKQLKRPGHSRQETSDFKHYTTQGKIQGELVSEREPIIMCPFIRPTVISWIAEERWQSGRMRIIANDVTPEMGSEGSNPSLSVPRARIAAGFFRVLSDFCRQRRCFALSTCEGSHQRLPITESHRKKPPCRP